VLLISAAPGDRRGMGLDVNMVVLQRLVVGVVMMVVVVAVGG
jgi:hypothetical protein